MKRKGQQHLKYSRISITLKRQVLWVGAFAGHTMSEPCCSIQNCWIFDTAANAHVCNDPTRLKLTRPADEDDYLMTGTTAYKIEAYGTVTISVETPTGKRTIDLLETVLVPGFLTNCVSGSRLNRKGVHEFEQDHRFQDPWRICQGRDRGGQSTQSDGLSHTRPCHRLTPTARLDT